MANSTVSIIVPCYNQSQFLDECLQSILEQTYQNWECIIVNDGSHDDTEKIAQQWLQKDSRFKYLTQKNGGLSSARNAGLNIANGSFIQFLDADDILDRNKLYISLGLVESTQEQNVIITGFNMFKLEKFDTPDYYCDLKEEYFAFNRILFDWDFQFSIPIHCGLFSASLFDDFRFAEDLKAKEDWLMWLLFFKKQIKIYYTNKALAFYRLHHENMTKDLKHMNDNTIKSFKYLEQILQPEQFKVYILHRLKCKTDQYEVLVDNYKNLQFKEKKIRNSLGYRIEKKIKEIFLNKKT